MMDWNKIEGYNQNMTYEANKENGVCLPDIDRLVVVCESGDEDDYYRVSLVVRSKTTNEVYMVDKRHILEGYSFENNIFWAYIDEPETKNNIHYAIACRDKDGHNFCDKNHIPVIIKATKEDILLNIGKLAVDEYRDITVFKYMGDNPYEYDWDYVRKHLVPKEEYNQKEEI